MYKSIYVIIACLIFAGAQPVWASEERRSELESEIEQLDNKIRELQQQHAQTAQEANIIAGHVARMQAELEKAQLELRNTQLAIANVQEKQKGTQDELGRIQEEIEEKRDLLRSLVRLMHEKSQRSWVQIFFGTLSIGEVFSQQAAYADLQERMVKLIQDLRDDEQMLSNKQDELATQESQLVRMQGELAAQQSSIADKRREQEAFLQATREEQLEYEHLITEARQARDEIKQQVFTLRSGGSQTQQVSLSNAFDMARYAGSLTGVRPALLLGVLWVESNVGENLGSGVYPDNMHSVHHEAFLDITERLGMDPHTTPVSRAGAMGPAQFMPRTWLGIEGRVQQATGKESVSPYELSDAFVAAALYLADHGASNSDTERSAIARYIGCNCTNYVNRVLAVAQEYQRELDR